MDGERFDLIARIAGSRGTRRGALAALLALAGGSGSGTLPDAAAKKKRKCKPACPSGQTCRKGTCACPSGQRVCGLACCFEDQACDMGICVPCTLLAGSDPAADGQALKSQVTDPDGPSTIWLGEGVYEVMGGGLLHLAPLEIWRDVTLASCNPERPATISCPVMENGATCVVARPNLVVRSRGGCKGSTWSVRATRRSRGRVWWPAARPPARAHRSSCAMPPCPDSAWESGRRTAT